MKTVLLMYSNHYPSREHISRLAEIAPGYAVRVASSEKEALKYAPDAHIIMGHRYLRQVLELALHLRWVQSSAGGIDRMPLEQLRERNIALSRTSFPSNILARHAHTLAWALIRGIPECCFLQQKKIWSTAVKLLPQPKAALVMGVGAIGKDIARLLKRDGIRVYGVKRSRDDESRALCDRLLGMDEWRAVLPDADIVFLALPNTRFSRGIFDADAIAHLPAHAVIVNVGRQETMDTPAIISALRNERLGGAALDVFERTPLPQDDPLWEAPRFIVSPYIAGRYPGRAKDLESYFEKQLERFLKNEKPENSISWKEAGDEYGC
ncbi:MAG: NAD(P)-binding domain-containing protein [Candidatus Omnitrophica bacterium]|nr:NAD(P)-binding domain-containing protein [Candidatus Omnitrophota bacterium]